MKRNRWLIALSAVGIHICIGSVYAWSVLTKPVMAAMGLSLGQTTWAFSIAILFLGLSAGVLGCGAHGAFPLWPAFGMLLCPGDAGNRICDICEEYSVVVFVLWLYRRDWAGNRIHYSGINSG